MSCRPVGLLTCCLLKQLEKQSKPMLFRLQNAANSLSPPTMTVPFDTDDCATIPRVGHQPVGPHTAHGGPRLRFCGTVASVESGSLGHTATPFVLPMKGRPTAWPGLPPGATKVRPRSRPATRKKKILWSCAWFWQSGRFQFYYYWAFHSAHGPARYSASRTPSCRLLLRYLYGPPFS